MLGIKPGVAGCKASMLPLCYAATYKNTNFIFQLCSRGRIHVFKYLEIQAIKEDRKRGVLTDSEYRRSYRKTTQLNDFRYFCGCPESSGIVLERQLASCLVVALLNQ